jgi:DNA end-binding protein Ku
MSARPTWKGVLKISLVTIPIKVFPATESSSGLDFNQLHKDCQSRVTQKRWCGTCEREVPTAEIVKGHEFEKGRYVILSDEDFAKVRPPSTRVIDLVQFAAAAALDPMYVDRTYYLAPDGLGGEAFAVVRLAMRGRVGVGKLALYGREYLVAVRPVARHLVLHTLHHAAEIRQVDAFELDGDAVEPAIPQVRLGRQVIAALTGPLDLSGFQDDYKAGLQTVIDAKIAGQEIVVPPLDTPPVVNLREALTQSLAVVSAKKKPARVNTDGTKRKKRA